MKTTTPRRNRVSNTLALVLGLSVISGIVSCEMSAEANEDTNLPVTVLTVTKEKADSSGKLVNTGADRGPAADAATIIARKQVPVLCYHHIKDWTAKTSERAKDYIVPVDVFRAQMKMLADSGYQTILPDQLNDYLAYNVPLPPKPVMLTFDDTDLEQYTVALPEMKKYGFKGVFFIMTVSLNRPNYMTREQVKALSDEGHEIGSHTWDHRNVKKYEAEDWLTQIEKPTRQLSAITGKPVKYFAYPFGLWNPEAIPELKKRGFAGAYQLSVARDPNDPLYTIRRIIVPGSWGANRLSKGMTSSFR